MQALKKLIVANDNVIDVESSRPRLQDSLLRSHRVPAPQTVGTTVVAVGLCLGSPSWQVWFLHNLLYNGFVFQVASIKEKQILLSLSVIAYATARVRQP
jgi:multisubunit Na+/H+ antiporter MnhG subunit